MTENFQRFRDEEARLIILKELADQVNGRSTETMLTHVLDAFAIPASRDYVRSQIRKLQEVGGVTFQEIGSVMIAEITRAGSDHVQRRCILEGVRRPSPGI